VVIQNFSNDEEVAANAAQPRLTIEDMDKIFKEPPKKFDKSIQQFNPHQNTQMFEKLMEKGIAESIKGNGLGDDWKRLKSLSQMINPDFYDSNPVFSNTSASARAKLSLYVNLINDPTLAATMKTSIDTLPKNREPPAKK
jgi:hypothetical protein